MKAAILEGYGRSGRDLVLGDVPAPEIGDTEVLVRVRAAGVNPLDNMIVRGEVKLIVPYRFPLIMGNELVGVVERTGNAATKFSAGERVYGRMPLAKIGAFAEYAAVDESALAKVPDYLTDEEAACVPLTALTAVQALELMQPVAGQSVFISGGTGSLGAMAIPLAKGKGLTVITNGSAANRERVLGLGADVFIDYKTQDYADVVRDVDFVLDTLGDRELEKEFGILKPGGSLVSLRGVPNAEFAERSGLPAVKRLMFRFAGAKYDKLAARRDQRYFFVFVHEDGAGLEEVSQVFSERKIKASIDEVFALGQVNEAMRKVAAGKSRGKTVLTMDAKES